jgi:hypothetical protein
VTPDDSEDYFGSGKGADDIQEDIAINDGKITGVLKFIEGGIASGVLEGDGYFIGLKFDDFAEGLTYEDVTVALVPSSTGMKPVTLDADQNCVFKITDKNTQRIKVEQADGAGHRNVQYFDLDGLTLEEVGA